MIPTIITVCVYIIVISNAAYLIVEMYRFVKRKIVKEPRRKMPPSHFNFIGWSDSEELPPKFP